MSKRYNLLSLFRPEPSNTLSGMLHGLTGRLDAAERAFFLSKNHLAVGQWAEELVACLLARQGMTRMERNVRCGASELDVIGLWRDTLIFVEVRCRRQNPLQDASETVGHRKWHSLVRGAELFVAQQRWTGPWRIDLAALTVEQWQWRLDWFSDLEGEV